MTDQAVNYVYTATLVTGRRSGAGKRSFELEFLMLGLFYIKLRQHAPLTVPNTMDLTVEPVADVAQFENDLAVYIGLVRFWNLILQLDELLEPVKRSFHRLISVHFNGPSRGRA